MKALSALALVVVVVSILLVGIDPGFDPPPWLGDKLQHVLAFVAVAILSILTWPRAGPWSLLVGISSLAAAIEGMQWGMAVGREADWGDLFVGIGAAAATLFCVFLLRRLAALLAE